MITLKKCCNSKYSKTIAIEEFLKDVKMIVFYSEACEVKINLKRRGKIYYHEWMTKLSDWESFNKPYRNKIYILEDEFKEIVALARSIGIVTRICTDEEWNKRYSKKKGTGSSPVKRG
jgi:hypothetical protein